MMTLHESDAFDGKVKMLINRNVSPLIANEIATMDLMMYRAQRRIRALQVGVVGLVVWVLLMSTLLVTFK
jgi:hypothetical protein